MPEHAHAPLVAPFRGERYVETERLSDLVAPPYDVISAEARRSFGARHPHNVVHLTLPEGEGDRYERAAALLRAWRAAGVLATDRSPSVYVVREEFVSPDGRSLSRTGVVGAVAVESLAGGRVIPHERTHAEPKADRLALMEATAASFEPLFMLARDPGGELRRELEHSTAAAPTATAELLGERITLWRLADDAAAVLAAACGDALYIADGHHRYETAVAYRRANPAGDRTPALVVPVEDPGLLVLPTHRMVYGKPVDGDALAAALRERFHVRELPRSANYRDELSQLRDRGTASLLVTPERGALLLLLKGGARLGELPLSTEPAVAQLDVARIDELLVKRLRAEAGPDARVAYSADHHHVIDEVRRGRAAAGVLLNPTPLEQVLAVADAGAVMPQKSTYFMPKVPSGLVMLGHGEL